MKIQRFYVKEMHNRFGPIDLGQTIWLHDEALVGQLLKVFRAKVGYQLILFNDSEERLYKITVIDGKDSIKVELVTTLKRQLPNKKIYLFWSVLKKDKNEWIIQKATELGVHKFIPVLSERSERSNFDAERAQKIIIEATEQCGRGDVPELLEPAGLHEILAEYSDLPLFICEQNEEHSQTSVKDLDKVGVLIGPEGGWSDSEKTEFKNRDMPHMQLSGFTLRAETAAITVVSKLLA